MRSPFVKRQIVPRSGFFAFFPLQDPSTGWRNQLFGVVCTPRHMFRPPHHLWPSEACRCVSHEVLALARFRCRIGSAPSWQTWSTAAGDRTTKSSGPRSADRVRMGSGLGTWRRRCGSVTRRSDSGVCAGPTPPPSGRPRLKRARFTSVDELRQRIVAFMDDVHNTMAKPFPWTSAGRPFVAYPWAASTGRKLAPSCTSTFC
jgi:hypothetical protein